MTATIDVFPLGNADTTRLTLADGQRILFDFADMGRSEGSDIEYDLEKAIKDDLGSAPYKLPVVCITHVDDDHCHGFGDVFWLQHATKYQDDDRIKIDELWVPAAAILEEGLTRDSRLVREEAKHRLLEGKGIRVFSSPKILEDWLSKKGLTLASRKNCIVNAGQLVPGFSIDADEKVEFFVHCPLSWVQDQDGEINRNNHSIVVQATFAEGSRKTRALLGSDVDSDALTQIVKSTIWHGNSGRLEWDLLKLFHHCSYKALNVNDCGIDKTTPVPEVAWLIEDQGQDRSIIISPSKKIPTKGAKEDDKQPPHRQAAAYYRPIQDKRNGSFVVTMDKPNKAAKISITAFGASIALSSPAVAGSGSTSKPVRSG
jgi:ribonuclease BN (tRNA processing enzyme)